MIRGEAKNMRQFAALMMVLGTILIGNALTAADGKNWTADKEGARAAKGATTQAVLMGGILAAYRTFAGSREILSGPD